MGATLGGWLAGRWGYTAPLALAAVGVALGVLLTFAGGLHSPAAQSEAKGR
jgi:predicted MFS family arabinose efflux permease